MKWLAPYLLALLALASPTRRAEAQVLQGLNGITIGGNDLKLTAKINISGAQCNEEFVFALNNVQPRVPMMEVWVTSQVGVDCNTQAARSNALAGQKTQCWKAAELPNAVGKIKYRVPGNLIFDQDRDMKCDPDLTDQPYWLHFVPLQTRTLPDSPMNPEANPGPRYRVQFFLFSDTPQPPSGIKVKGGEKSIQVKWDGLADPTRGSQVFFDVAPEVDGDACSSSVLVGTGNDIKVDKVRVFTTGRVSKTSASLGDLEKKGVTFGDKVAVAVAQVDAAGNIGDLSPAVCATVVETTSAIDACGSPEECGLETCGLSPASRGSWLGLSMFGLLLAALIRRRTA